jgi:hypothetical protein
MAKSLNGVKNDGKGDPADTKLRKWSKAIKKTVFSN